MFCKSGILIFIFAENNYSIYAHTMLIKTPLLHQSLGPHVFLSFFLSLSPPPSSSLCHFLIVDSGPPGSGPLKDPNKWRLNRDTGIHGISDRVTPGLLRSGPVEVGKY